MYPQHMFQLRNKKIKFSLRTLNKSPARSIQIDFVREVGVTMCKYIIFIIIYHINEGFPIFVGVEILPHSE